MIAFHNILFFLSFQYKNCPVFVLWAPLRKYVIGNKSPILRGLLPRLIVPNGNKWNSCPLLMICCQPISSMVIAHSKENGSIHRNIIIWRFWRPCLFFQTNNHTAGTVLYAPNLKHCQEKTKKYDFIITIPQKQVITMLSNRNKNQFCWCSAAGKVPKSTWRPTAALKWKWQMSSEL